MGCGSSDHAVFVWGRSARFGSGRKPELTILKVAPGSKPKTFYYWFHESRLRWLQLTPDGTRLAVKGASATDLVDLTQPRPRKIRRLKDWGPDYCGAISHNGKWLAVGSWNKDIRIHDAPVLSGDGRPKDGRQGDAKRHYAAADKAKRSLGRGAVRQTKTDFLVMSRAYEDAKALIEDPK